MTRALAGHLARHVREARGVKVLLDEDLALLYGVEVKALNQAVHRNLARFPADFMFQLTAPEHALLRSQSVTLVAGRGRHRKYLPYAFTEQGVAMLSSVLRSERAIQVNVEIMRVFVRLRAMVIEHSELSRRLDSLEAKYDDQFRAVFDAIRDLMAPPPKSKRPAIGFVPSKRP
jgi:ORF6N domain